MTFLQNARVISKSAFDFSDAFLAIFENSARFIFRVEKTGKNILTKKKIIRAHASSLHTVSKYFL